MPFHNLGVVGTGAWGTALAAVAARAGRRVTLWAREAGLAAAINQTGRNPRYLDAIDLPDGIDATADPARLAGADALLAVVPAQHLGGVLARLADQPPRPVAICAKGIELSTGRLMTEVVADTLPGWPQAVVSGPTFAAEVARGLPTAVTVAADNRAVGEAFVAALGDRGFRPYLSDDPVGVEVSGAVKNVIAIACGIVEGRGLGDNARAALMTRGLAEIARLVDALGGRPETLRGLAGLGDLTLTCNAMQSRNFSLGVALGRGESTDQVLAGRIGVTEGVATAPAVVARAARHGVEMPIAAAVARIVHDGARIDTVIGDLLARPLKAEL